MSTTHRLRIMLAVIIIVATLNRTMRSFLLAIVGAEYVLRWLPRGTHDWRRFVRPDEVARTLEANGISTSALTGVSFDPFANSWRLTGNHSVNYMLVGEKAAPRGRAVGVRVAEESDSAA